jgi:serine/threonine-protein kinase
VDAISQLSAGLGGRYTIDREIGVGGMATVYLARDVKHDRLVALKVLKPELGAVLGVDRFLAEIRVTAGLQHPNLLPLFDSGEADGNLFYVMPYVEGETLRRHIDREKQLPVEQAVHIATSIAGALDYAHRHGVVHRDLKPENILLHDGQPLIADFGIALAISNAAGARMTQSGLSLGTPQYMSPEQATADRQIDGRTDIYSLGAVTYEMLTGEPPHTGTTAQAVIAKLMTEEPRAVSTLRRTVPPHVDAAVHRALERLPADRFGTAHEFADALSGKTVAAFLHARPASSSATRWKVAAVTSMIAFVAALGWGIARGPDGTAPARHMELSLVLPDSVALDVSNFLSHSFDLSPDGTQFAYVGPNGLFLRRLDSLTPRRLTSDGAERPHFSPDGAWVGYVSGHTLRKIPVNGGTPVTVADSVLAWAWSRLGTIVFTRAVDAADLWRVADTGGRAERIVHQLRPGDFAYGTPSFLPDGDAFVVPVRTEAQGAARELAAYRLSDGMMRYLGLPGGGSPRYLPGGILLFLNPNGDMSAVRFDTRTLRITGTPIPVLSDVMTKLTSAELAVSENGTLVYLPGMAPRQLVELDRAGGVRVLGQSSGAYSNPRYSPDGRRVALSVGKPPVGAVWIYDNLSSTMSRLTDDHRVAMVEWTPDGRRVAWMQAVIARGLHWRAADLSDSESTLLLGGSGMAFSPKNSPGGDYFVTGVAGQSGRRALIVVRLDSTRRQTPIPESSGASAPSISPDGRWLAYLFIESGRSELYVRSMSGLGGRHQMSASGATEPTWNPRGGELFYRVGARLIAATLEFAPEPRVVRRDTLAFAVTTPPNFNGASYGVSADGRRFIMARPVGGSSPPIIVTGWLDEVRARLKAQR